MDPGNDGSGSWHDKGKHPLSQMFSGNVVCRYRIEIFFTEIGKLGMFMQFHIG